MIELQKQWDFYNMQLSVLLSQPNYDSLEVDFLCSKLSELSNQLNEGK